MDDQELDKLIDDVFEEAARERHVHSHSKETFDNVAGLWYLSPKSAEVIAKVAKTYIVSSFLLEKLGLEYGEIREMYNLPEFTAEMVTNDEKRYEFIDMLSEIIKDERFMNWFNKYVVDACNTILESSIPNTLCEISSLGNLANICDISDFKLFLSENLASPKKEPND